MFLKKEVILLGVLLSLRIIIATYYFYYRSNFN